MGGDVIYYVGEEEIETRIFVGEGEMDMGEEGPEFLPSHMR